MIFMPLPEKVKIVTHGGMTPYKHVHTTDPGDDNAVPCTDPETCEICGAFHKIEDEYAKRMLRGDLILNFFLILATVAATLLAMKDNDRAFMIFSGLLYLLIICKIKGSITRYRQRMAHHREHKDDHFKRPAEQRYPVMLPPGAWFTEISGWYRVRIATPNCDNEEIGCGNTKEAALDEAWRWWFNVARKALRGKCWYCEAEWDTDDELKEATCPACKNTRNLYG